MKRNLLVLFLALLISGTSQAQTVDEIIDNYFENTGGKKAWKKIKSMKVVGKVSAQGLEIPATIYTKAPNMIKMVMEVNNMTMIPQAYDGEVAWMINPFAGSTEPQKLPEEQTKEMSEQADFEPVYLDYKSKGHEITLEGKEEIEGAECFKLKVVKNKNNDKKESVEYHFFDTENFVPIMIRNTAQSGPTKGMATETFMSDYQEVGNFIMAFYTEQKVAGQVAFKMSVTEIVVDEKVEDDFFKFPGE